MAIVVLGLDIGGANLKAATTDRQAVSLSFPLWKDSDGLSAKLAELLRLFPVSVELAVTMTGELCDCYESKRVGVQHILKSVEAVAGSRTVRVWSTAGRFLSLADARDQWKRVAAGNWHALATWAGRFHPTGFGWLIDIGTTTTDLIPIRDGLPVSRGCTDPDRLRSGELVYTGTKRTPVCALSTEPVAAEFFATTRDVYTVLGWIPEDPMETDTADGRPAIIPHSLTRLARMLGGDRETHSDEVLLEFARSIQRRQCDLITERFLVAQRHLPSPTDAEFFIISGSGEFLARQWLGTESTGAIISLTQELGPDLSAAAPAFALAVLASERRP